MITKLEIRFIFAPSFVQAFALQERGTPASTSRGPMEKPPIGFQTQLKAAETYLQQGLLDEAEEIYVSIQSGLQKRLEQDETEKTLKPSVRNRISTALTLLAIRLTVITQKKAALQPVDGNPVKKISPDLSPESMIERGVLLQGMGLYDDAIEEYNRAEALKPELVGKCHELTGDALAGKGNLAGGIARLRQAFDLATEEPQRRMAILEKIAEAYEAGGEKAQALSAYRELILLNADCGRALLKIEQLSGELKQSSLNFGIICKYPKSFLIMSLVIALFFGTFNLFVKTANNVDYFTLKDNPDITFYEEFKKVFGEDEFYVIAVQSEDIFSAPNLTMLREVTEALEALPEIDDVLSLANADDIAGGTDSFEVKKFIEEIPTQRSDLDALRQRAGSNPLYLKNLISTDGKTAAIVVKPKIREEDNDFRKHLLAKTDAILKPYEGKSLQFYVGGWTVTNYNMSKYLNEDTLTFIPLTYLLIALSIWLFFRNIRIVLLGIANISLCMFATRGAMGLLGVSVNSVTVIILPLIMAMALADTIHIFSNMDRQILDRFKDERQALAHILNHEGLPCFLTTLTTAIGFASLYTSKMPPIKEFALVATAGMGFEFLFGFFFLAPLILFCNPERVYMPFKDGPRMPVFLNGLLQLALRYSKWIILGSILLILGSGYLATQIKTETNLVEFFRKSSPVRTALSFVETHLAGVGSLDVSFKAQEPDAFKNPANLAVIETVQKFIAGQEGVDKTISLVDFLKDMNQSFHEEDKKFYVLPDSADLVAQYLLLYSSDDLEDFVNSDFDHARLAARLSIHSSAKQKQLIQGIESLLAGMKTPGITIHVTGKAVKEVSIVDAVVDSQVSSLASSAFVISIILFVVFRSVSLAILAMIPNVFPIILNFGIMGGLNIHLDTGTALISSIALGIAVDDTIHFFTEYQRKRSEGLTLLESLEVVFQGKGRAVITTGIVFCIGFSVLIFSRFIPVANFGLLSALIMITGLVGELLLLPAIMLSGKQHRTKS